ncbi:TIGR02221 family CRISPR-associated protein [Salisaeta longa]|uniref:TIGR02221 family CRISPR-associated protein n=1 Tax=Salisaeta longa TaxID=503170 RepID=UPI00058D5A38|nr:TIGR02221 family CRISPR-associated protein [Salisaeta longa]
MATEQLLLLLGKGPADVATVQTGGYRQATYFRSEYPGENVQTPFVGEALASLYPDRFDTIHILGTPDAMWDVLLQHYDGTLEDEQLIEQLLALEDQQPTALPSPLRDRIQHAVGVAFDTRIETHLIPIGTSPAAYWDILERLTALNITGGAVSIDITHSLRSHPLFLLLALVYLRSLHSSLELGSVFYGALALTNKYFDGKTPIFDLRPMVKLLDWTEAATAFERYGDAAPIARLIQSGDAFEDLAKRATFVSQVLQLNTLSRVQTNTHKLIGLLDAVEDEASPLLAMIRPKLRALPQALQGVPRWQAMLTVARQHWTSYRAGSAVLALWEAIIDRLALAYDLLDADPTKTYRALRPIACGQGTTRWFQQQGLGRFPKRAEQLREYRNGIAHPREQDYEPPEVYDHFPGLLSYFEEHLGSVVLDRLPDDKPVSL